MNTVKVENLVKRFKSREVLNNINFVVKQGEFVSVVGPSGSGKSTLLNILGMLESSTSGKIELFGQKLPKINSHEAMIFRREKINYLFQSFALVSNETVKNNLLLALKFANKSKNEKNKLIKEILIELNIDYLENTIVNTLSGGEQQRVALARTILKPGELILADEPTGALDPKHAREAFSLIENLRDKYNKTIIMVTHNLEEARKTDRIIDISRI